MSWVSLVSPSTNTGAQTEFGKGQGEIPLFPGYLGEHYSQLWTPYSECIV